MVSTVRAYHQSLENTSFMGDQKLTTHLDLQWPYKQGDIAINLDTIQDCLTSVQTLLI